MADTRAVVQRLEGANGRHPDVTGASGSTSGGSRASSADLGPLRLRGPPLDLDLQSPLSSPLVVEQLLHQEQQYHPQHKGGRILSGATAHSPLASAAQQHLHLHLQPPHAGRGDEELGKLPAQPGSSRAGNGTHHHHASTHHHHRAAALPATPPMSPKTLQDNGRLALLSMLLLVFQGTALSIMLRFSRARAGKAYLASTSVILTECIKFVICIAMQARAAARQVSATRAVDSSGKAAGGGGAGHQAALWRELRRQARDIAAQSLPMLLPAGMFVMQQVLLIVAATHLDAVAFQIFSQSFKLVPTALFAYWLLGQVLEPMQWASIPVLALGVILVTVNNGGSVAGRSAAATAVSSSSSGLDYVAGMVACSVSGLSSAYAGVYFEKYVKGRHAASLWVRNIQLGMYGVPLSTAYALIKDGRRIRRGGLMQGFDAATWIVIALQVFGGLVTGMVVKYCDNILKNFALAISVILTVLVAIPLFGQWPSPVFLLGVALVLLSVFMYGRAVDTRKLHLWWQRTLKRLIPADSVARSRRLLALMLLAAVATGFVLIATGLRSSRALGRGLPLTRDAARRTKPKLTDTELALRLAQIDRSDGGGRRGKKGGVNTTLRSKVGQLLRDSAGQQQLIADGGRRHQHRRRRAT